MAKPTFGVTFKMGASSPPSTTISSVIAVSPPKMAQAAIDVTEHDSAGGAQQYMPDGVYDPGQIEVTMHYVAGSADDDACIAAFASTDPYYFSWTANAASGTETFTAQGVVTSYGPDALPVSGKQTATLAIQLSGAVTQAATA